MGWTNRHNKVTLLYLTPMCHRHTYICLFWRKKISSLQLTNEKKTCTCHLHLHLHHHHHQRLGKSSRKFCEQIPRPFNTLSFKLLGAGCLRMSWPRPQAKSKILRLPFIPSIKPGALTRKLRFVGLSTGFNKQKVSWSPWTKHLLGITKEKNGIFHVTLRQNPYSQFSHHVQRLLYHHYSQQHSTLSVISRTPCQFPNQPTPPWKTQCYYTYTPLAKVKLLTAMTFRYIPFAKLLPNSKGTFNHHGLDTIVEASNSGCHLQLTSATRSAVQDTSPSAPWWYLSITVDFQNKIERYPMIIFLSGQIVCTDPNFERSPFIRTQNRILKSPVP